MLGSAAGNPLTLECIVESYPKSFVVWSIGGKNSVLVVVIIIFIITANVIGILFVTVIVISIVTAILISLYGKPL